MTGINRRQKDSDRCDMMHTLHRAIDGPAKMVLVVRTDLGMTKGKVAAQCAHAAVMCYKKVAFLFCGLIINCLLQALADQPKVLSSWETLGQTKVYFVYHNIVRCLFRFVYI